MSTADLITATGPGRLLAVLLLALVVLLLRLAAWPLAAAALALDSAALTTARRIPARGDTR